MKRLLIFVFILHKWCSIAMNIKQEHKPCFFHAASPWFKYYKTLYQYKKIEHQYLQCNFTEIYMNNKYSKSTSKSSIIILPHLWVKGINCYFKLPMQRMMTLSITHWQINYFLFQFQITGAFRVRRYDDGIIIHLRGDEALFFEAYCTINFW